MQYDNFVNACNQVMNGILATFVGPSDLMLTALGVHRMDYLNQRYSRIGIQYVFMYFITSNIQFLLLPCGFKET